MQEDRGTVDAYFGLSDLIIWMRRNWLTLGASVAVGVILGISYALIATPYYKVETLLAPQKTAESNQLMSQLGSRLGAFGLGSVLGRDSGSEADVAVAILQSRKFLGEFIERHALLPQLFASRWDNEAGTWIDDGESPPSINDGYRKFTMDVLSVDTHEATGFVTVAIEWKDPAVAHDWLEALVADLNEGVRQRERDEATRSLEFLREELQRTDLMDLRQALHQLSLAELQKLTLANVREEFAFKVIDPPSKPDADDPTWPKPVLVLLSSAIFGFLVGLVIAASRAAWQASRRGA